MIMIIRMIIIIGLMIIIMIMIIMKDRLSLSFFLSLRSLPPRLASVVPMIAIQVRTLFSDGWVYG